MPIIIEGPDGAGKYTHIAVPSDTPRPAVSEYRLDNAIITEVNDEN